MNIFVKHLFLQQRYLNSFEKFLFVLVVFFFAQLMSSDSSENSSSLPMLARPASRRVKVYELVDETGQWADKGTGFVQCHFVEVTSTLCFYKKTKQQKQNNKYIHKYLY